MKRKPKPPTPAQLLAKADALPRGIILSDYLAVMWKLKDGKGMSLRQIAAWLTLELGVPVTHMQVYRAMESSLPPPERLQSVEEVVETENKRADLKEEFKQ
jgi:hypothetical protein